MSQVLVRNAVWPDDENSLRQLRAQVFIDEQRVPADIEWDGRDAECDHVIAECDNHTVGCGRIMPDGRIGRLAVLPDFRGQGVGAQMLAQLLSQAQLLGHPRVYLHAQADAVSFYPRAGFTSRGAPFTDIDRTPSSRVRAAPRLVGRRAMWAHRGPASNVGGDQHHAQRHSLRGPGQPQIGNRWRIQSAYNGSTIATPASVVTI